MPKFGTRDTVPVGYSRIAIPSKLSLARSNETEVQAGKQPRGEIGGKPASQKKNQGRN
jgi:hypothetical protein